MNFQKILVIVALSFCAHLLLAQKVVTDTRYFDNYGLKCEGEILELGFNDEYSCFKARIGVCGDPSPDIFEDKVSEIEISGPGSPTLSPLRSYTIGSNRARINVMKAIVKLTETGEIRITSRSLFEYIVGDQCPTNPPESYIYERIWIHKVKVVQKPPTPSLTVERYISPYSVNFIASGCPTDNKEYDYEYQWNSAACLSEANEVFSRRGDINGNYYGDGSVNYRVRCTALNGTCKSEPSNFEKGASYRPPDLSKVPPEHASQIKRIKASKKYDLNPTYHVYSLETVVCSVDNDANCSVQNVFNILLSGNQFIAAITEDMRTINSNNVGRFNFDNLSPVESYAVVNLSGPAIRFFLETGLTPIAKLVPNPIMTYVDYQNFSVINYTLENHVLSPGRVIRKVVQKCKNVYIETIGEGYSDLLFPFNIAAAYINTSEGKRLFKNVDGRVKNEYVRQYK